MNHQRQLCNGQWIDISDEKASELLDRSIAFQAGVARMLEETPMTNEQLMAELAAGRSLRFDTDWYMNIRVKPAPQIRQTPELVRCSCGHSVPRTLVMNTSTGTACPDCYDRMSD